MFYHLKARDFLFIIILFASAARSQENNTMYAHYINVGQGASVLLEFPCGAMLIDAGASDDSYKKNLLAYLSNFFKRRTDLNNTLSLVMITHPHLDHNYVLDAIAQKYRVNNYIDDGLEVGSGRANQVWMQKQTTEAKINYESPSFEKITAGGNKKGLTDSVIDPINCQNGGPKITLYFGGFDKQPSDWSQTAFKNYNNQSLVIKVVFGKSSFLFTGDLEKKGLQKLVETYGNTKELDVDVLMVGHHGADNATIPDYLEMVSPQYAVISCGEWNDGKGGTNRFTTWYYGHPRISTLELLEQYIPSKRPDAPLKVKAAEGAQDFRFINIDKNIYSTSWDHNIVIKATTEGKYRITTN